MPSPERDITPPPTFMSSPLAIDALFHRYDSGEYFSRLINQPTPHPLRQAPVLVYHATLTMAEPQFTVVMPTFNHESNIHDSLDGTAAARCRLTASSTTG